MSAQFLGLATMGIIAVCVAALFLYRRLRPVFFFTLALIAVGLGFLATTNAPADFARLAFGAAGWIDFGAPGQ